MLPHVFNPSGPTDSLSEARERAFRMVSRVGWSVTIWFDSLTSKYLPLGAGIPAPAGYQPMETVRP